MTKQELIEELQQRDAVVARQDALIERHEAVVAELMETVRRLTSELEWCKRQLFGRKSERYEDPNQPRLFHDPSVEPNGGPHEQPAPAATITVQRRVATTRGKREPIPEHLRRERIVHDLPEEEKVDPATGAVLLQKIGEDVSEKLAFRPGEIYVEQHVRCKYRRLGHENLSGDEPEIISAPMPRVGLPRSIAAPSLLAEILTKRYVDHLPFDRQVKIFARQGVSLSKASMCRHAQDVGELLQPLIDLMKQRLLEHSRVIQHDDTPVRQQDPGRGATKTCRFWTAVGEPGTAGHYVLFNYTQNRGRAGPEAWFRDARNQPLFAHGSLQCDAYAGYNGLFDPRGSWKMVHIGCWAHARRHFHDARDSAPGQVCHALGLIRQLYAIEAAVRDASDEARLEVRQRQAKPLVDQFFAWCEEQQSNALPKSGIGEALSYALNLEEPLRRYLDAGHLQIDNNACERSLRGIAIGRRNWLFTGSPAGGLAAARLFSVIASAQLHDVEPRAYLQALITHLPATPPSRLHEFLPDIWSASAPQA